MKKVISKDGNTIAYNKTGTGPALILVDGALCNSTFGPMPKLVPLLSKHFTVISYDRRGRGNSTDNTPYIPDREVEDIEALINASGGPVYVFGMSSGAILSLMALANNLPVTKLALYEPPFEVDEKSAQDSSNHYDNLKELIATDNRSGAVKYFLKDVVGMPSFIVIVMSWLPMWKKMEANANSLPYDVKVTNDYPLQSLKSTSSSPILVMCGDKSPENLQRAAKAVSDRMEHSTMQLLEGQSHNVSMKALAPVLIDFFRDKK